MNRMMAIVEREMRKFFRSPALMLASMIFPLVQLIILGNAFGGKIHDAKVAIVDQDGGPQALRIRQAFDAVDSRKIRESSRGKSEVVTPSERLRANECARFLLDLRNVSVGYRAYILRERIENLPSERNLLLRSSRGQHDFGTREHCRWQRHVHFVAANLPAAANDSADRIIEPRAGATDLDFLSPWKPETTVDQAVFQNDAYILELFVEERRACEAECHANDFPALLVDEHRADTQGHNFSYSDRNAFLISIDTHAGESGGMGASGQ